MLIHVDDSELLLKPDIAGQTYSHRLILQQGNLFGVRRLHQATATATAGSAAASAGGGAATSSSGAASAAVSSSVATGGFIKLKRELAQCS